MASEPEEGSTVLAVPLALSTVIICSVVALCTYSKVWSKVGLPAIGVLVTFNKPFLAAILHKSSKTALSKNNAHSGPRPNEEL